MGCIITYKGKKYSEEQFKEYFINNKQEFATSIAKNKDVIEGFKEFVQGKTNSVKPGVSELFDSNPELANGIYKALGFKSNLKTSLGKELEYKDTYVPTNRLKDFKQYQVLDEKGNDIGSVVIEYRGSKNVILHPKLKIEGKGYGKDLYKFISNKFNVEIQEWNEGAIANSSAAKKMWDSLEKEGTAKRIFDEEQGDNFRVLNYRQEITPQQKQEAQELYSQYLDTKQPDVILPIGTSGSGKSTFIKSLPQENLVVIEPDAMRVEFTGNMNDKSKDKEIYIEAAKRAIKAIKQGKQVVFDTTNLTKDKRLPFIEAIKKEIPNVNIQYKLMELNPELAKQRIKAQLERGENRAAVSDETIDRHAESYKQMLEDIKNEPITEYKDLGSKQDIEGFKEFVEDDASFSVKRKTYQESLNTLEIYGYFQENGFSKEGVKKDMLPQVKRHLGTLLDIVDIKVASNEQLYLTYQGKKITFSDLKTIVKNLSPNTQEYRGLNVEDVEYLQDNKDIFLRVLHENKRERAWDITSDFIVNNLEAIMNNPNTFFNQAFKNKDVISYKEMSDVFKGSHVVAKVVEKYSKFLETYTIKRHFDETNEKDVRTGLGVFNVLNDKMVVSELNIFINVFLKKSYYNAYASFFNTVEEKKDFTKAFIKDVNREALETFAHESVHLVVGKQLRHDILQEEQNKEVSQEYRDLKALMEHSLRYLPHLKDVHEFSDIQEFVAEALTNGSFKKALLGVPASTEVNVSKYPPINFFKQLLDALVKYLSLSNITTFEESVLKQIMIVTDSLAEKSFENNLPSKINDLIALLEPTLEGVQSLENTGLINKMC